MPTSRSISNFVEDGKVKRYKYVHFEGCKSDLLEIKTGIPQGSILGPLFFSILLNVIANSSNKLSFLMYADDTTIYFNLEDFPSFNREYVINGELEKNDIWFQLNKLTLNVEKKIVCFSINVEQ